MDKNTKENITALDIERKFTPLLPKMPLFSSVAPNKESITLPKKPKNAEI